MSKHLLVVLILATTAFATQLAHRSQPVRRQLECSDFDKRCGDGCIWFAWDCCIDGTYCGPYQVCGLYGGCDLISLPPGASSGAASSIASGSASVKPLSPTSAGTSHPSSLTQAASSSSASNSQLASSSTSGTATAPTSTLVQASGALGAAVNKNAIALGLMMTARHLFL